MGIITLPFSFVDGNVIEAPQWMSDLNAILAQVNGGLDNTNIRAGANISTSKLANDGGITIGMLAPGQVGSTQLASGATTHNGRLVIATNASPIAITPTEQSILQLNFAPQGPKSIILVVGYALVTFGFYPDQAIQWRVARTPPGLAGPPIVGGGSWAYVIGSAPTVATTMQQSEALAWMDQPGGSGPYTYDLRMAGDPYPTIRDVTLFGVELI